MVFWHFLFYCLAQYLYAHNFLIIALYLRLITSEPHAVFIILRNCHN